MRDNLKINPIEIISRYYVIDSLSFNILVEHGMAVAQKAIQLAGRVQQLDPDMLFIEEASMLHDIAIFMCEGPQMGCFGDEEYICHGFLGRQVLEKEGLPRHALVCERHVGMGISVDDVIAGNLPLPERDMLPVSLEEKIICLADKFFSKRIDSLHKEKPIEEVRREISRYGEGQLRRFDELCRLFQYD